MPLRSIASAADARAMQPWGGAGEMVNEKLTDAQACPDCGATQGYRTTGISIMNPVGCEEIVSPVRCATCGRHYWEILEDCWFHGGQRSTRRIPAKLADVV